MVEVTTEIYKTYKAPVKTSSTTNQCTVFLQAECPSCRSTNSVKALKGKQVRHVWVKILRGIDKSIHASHSLSLSVVTHAPFHASVLRPTSWPNARDRRDGEVN